jgi:hypothetical protein
MKLTYEQKVQIYHDWKSNRMSATELAEHYHIALSNIQYLVKLADRLQNSEKRNGCFALAACRYCKNYMPSIRDRRAEASEKAMQLSRKLQMKYWKMLKRHLQNFRRVSNHE